MEAGVEAAVVVVGQTSSSYVEVSAALAAASNAWREIWQVK